MAIPLRRLWRAATTGRGGLLSGEYGIVCPKCGAKLRVGQTRILLGLLLCFALFLVVALYGAPALQAADLGLSDGVVLFILFAWVFLLIFAIPYYAPTLAELRILDPGESVRFPLTEAEEIDEAARAELAALAAQLVRPEGEQDELDGADWVCSTCREANARSFEVCWKCESARPER